mgnify:CR=1 FL=1
MSIYIGNNKYKEIYLGSNKISEVYLGSNKIYGPITPGPIPTGAVRVRTSDGNKPTRGSDPYSSATYAEALLVAGTTDVYDVLPQSGNYHDMLYSSTNVVEILGANVSGVTDLSLAFRACFNLISVALFDTSSVNNMEYMFEECYSLTSVPLFDTSNVTSMSRMFHYCYSLKSIPLFNTSKVIDMDYMFRNCYMVEGGALALYQQASTQTTPPSYHHYTFANCGRDTVTGAAELAQIPSGWK